MSIETRPTGRRGKLRAVLDYDAEELRNLAYAWGPRDGAYQELLEAADELDRLNGDADPTIEDSLQDKYDHDEHFGRKP